ncbi:MAG: (deoxy)nucleoside triphosphate pyrophosphohydrolase [Bacteroidia bacterium]
MATEYLEVSCAIIENNGKVLVAQRGADMSHPFKWEFPGGKWEAGETATAALHREIAEELGVEIEIRQALPPSCFSYPDKGQVRLWPFCCVLTAGKLQGVEHATVAWFGRQELVGLNWVEADVAVVQSYLHARGAL